MAKVQKTAFEETQELVQKIEDDLIKDIDIQIEDLDDEKPAEPGKTAIEEKVEEKKPVVEETKEENQEIDEAQLTESISKKVTGEVIAELDKRFPAQSKEEVKENKDALKEYLETAKASGRNPTWEEALAFVAEEGSRKIYDRIRQEDEQKKAEQEQAENNRRTQEEQVKIAQEEQSKLFNQVIDDELDELYSSNKLPRIKDKNDKNDVGVVARKALFATMLDVNEQRRQEGKPAIMSVSRIFHTYYKAPNTQPAGADAPISMGQGSAEATDPDDYSYADLKKEQRGWGWKWRR